MSSKHRSSGQRAKRIGQAPITPDFQRAEFTDSQIDVVPLDVKRDAVKKYIEGLERENKALREVITLMNRPLAPKPSGHRAHKGAGL